MKMFNEMSLKSIRTRLEKVGTALTTLTPPSLPLHKQGNVAPLSQAPLF